jgi:hypothetical protein
VTLFHGEKNVPSLIRRLIILQPTYYLPDLSLLKALGRLGHAVVPADVIDNASCAASWNGCIFVILSLRLAESRVWIMA